MSSSFRKTKSAADQELDDRSVSVIGVGVVGLSAALYLLRRGMSVEIIDELPPAGVASFGNSGFLVADTALPAALPGVAGKVPGWLADPVGPFAVKPGYAAAAAPWLARFLFASRKAQIFHGSDALGSLHCTTFKHWQDLVGLETFGHLIRRNGQIYLWDGPKASPKSGCEEALRHRLGINFEMLDQAQIQTLIPGVSSTISKGLFVPSNGHTVNRGRLVKVFGEKVRQAGGRFAHERVLKLIPREGIGWTLFTNVANRHRRTVLVACGAWSNRLPQPLGLSEPLESERGYHAVLPNPSVRLDFPILHKSGLFGVTSMEMGLRLAGTVEIAGLEHPPTERRARHIVVQARRLFPSIECDEPCFWMGHRPSLPDSLPVIGPFANSQGLFGCFGHGHAGLAGGPASGHLVAQLICGEKPDISAGPYSPSRFSCY
jgi:glycine/D-amino acid oxidase-like deaminating enzyme